MEKLLITGGAGYIGSHTTQFLVKNGFEPHKINGNTLGALMRFNRKCPNCLAVAQ